MNRERVKKMNVINAKDQLKLINYDLTKQLSKLNSYTEMLIIVFMAVCETINI